MSIENPRAAACFRFVEARYDASEATAHLVYAFDEGPELVEQVRFAGASLAVPAGRERAFAAALRLLHWIAGVSYYKAAVPAQIRCDRFAPDALTARWLESIYVNGLGEFAHRNGLDLRGRVVFPDHGAALEPAARLNLPRRSLVPIGGGKDSLVTLEALRAQGEQLTACYVGQSPLIDACIERSGMASLRIGRSLSPLLFEMNRNGAWNGHIPVTAINSAILVCAALLHGFDAVVFSNERSASVGNFEHDGFVVNHQWSKSFAFEHAFREHVHATVAADLDYYSALRPLSELAVTRQFATLAQYHEVFSSCNRNFRILGDKPSERWCGRCPKCHFVFLALAPFLPKTRLVAIFGRNFLDDPSLAAEFDALLEVEGHKPFECVGEGRESRAAMAALAARADWQEDALIQRFRQLILPTLNADRLRLEDQLVCDGEHFLPPRMTAWLHALAAA